MILHFFKHLYKIYEKIYKSLFGFYYLIELLHQLFLSFLLFPFELLVFLFPVK